MSVITTHHEIQRLGNYTDSVSPTRGASSCSVFVSKQLIKFMKVVFKVKFYSNDSE